MTTIAIFGATGTVGTQVCTALSHKNIPFKALVHSIAKAEKLKILKGAHLEEGDYYNPETLDKFLHGVREVFILTGGGMTDQSKAIADAAKKQGVKHIVKLSALGAEQEDPTKFVWAYYHRQTEEHIKSLGLNFTFLRPAYFASNLYRDAHNIKTDSNIVNNFGNAKINFITPEDIGEVAATILANPSAHINKLYEITGADTITFSDVAKLFSEVLGKQINYTPVSDADMRKISASFLPEQVLDGWMNMLAYFEHGGYEKSTDDVEKILGRKPQTVKHWIENNVAAFK